MNILHDITPGKNAPEIITTIIEIPAKSHNKYEIDKRTSLLKLDRVLHSAVHYPGNYGFIPQTHCDDEDPLDVIILGEDSLYPLTMCDVRPIGVIRMIDGGEQDDKIIGVLVHDPENKNITDISDVDEHKIAVIKHFFETYKLLEKKTVEITAIEGAQQAKEVINEAMKLYEKEFDKQ